jgi:hypothetical protein
LGAIAIQAEVTITPYKELNQWFISQTARTSCSPSPNLFNNVSLLMLIIALFTLAFSDGHVNDFYTE